MWEVNDRRINGESRTKGVSFAILFIHEPGVSLPYVLTNQCTINKEDKGVSLKDKGVSLR